uniref:ERCC4 domain-containing protein n=1 Tax=Macrostomum lignano TaxID=282301 RepID=A0A1I8FA28_9PLAT
QLEVHSLCRSRAGAAAPLVVYFFVYEGSRSSGYLTQLRKEKEAFEFLIRERSVAVVTKRAVVKGDLAPVEELAGPDDGIAAAPAEQHQLPCLLHRRGITILPVTIDVGDYVLLTPDICVERKSVVNMTQHYRSPVLLIEFDAERTGFAHLPRPGRHELGTELLGHDLPPEPAHPALPPAAHPVEPAPHASAELFHDSSGAARSRSCSCCPQSRPPPPATSTTTSTTARLLRRLR